MRFNLPARSLAGLVLLFGLMIGQAIQAEPETHFSELRLSAAESDHVCADLNGDPEKFGKCFARSYSDPILYARGGWCADNIYRLEHRFIELGANASDLEIVFITPTKVFDNRISLFPYQERFGKPGVGMAEWAFHVVLEYKRKIYDLDYMAEPTVVDVDTYFATMFPGQPIYKHTVAAPLFNLDFDLGGGKFRAEDFLRGT